MQTLAKPISVPAPATEKKQRLLSIDALRGFDMLLIAGGGTFLVLLENKTGLSWIDWIARQLQHPAWNGFTFYDFIFPLFLFIAGVSLPFSLRKGLASGLSKTDLYRKVFIRMLILIALGIVDKNTPIPFFEPSQIRVASVLGRIGIACFIATLLYLNFSWQKRILWVAILLLGYYAALFLIPVPGYGAGDLSIEGNLVGWIDRNFLPGRLLQTTYDELGLLTQIPALCLTVLGTCAGDTLLSDSKENKKLTYLLLSAFTCMGLGLVWSLHFPINKHLWSSSFILLTAGMSFLFLAVFYWVIDVLKYQKWTFFFKVIGMNSLTIYLAYRFIDFYHTSRLLFGGIYAPTPEPWHKVFEALGALGLVWLFLYVLYRQKIFIRI
jgi:predicted acyltransferase